MPAPTSSSGLKQTRIRPCGSSGCSFEVGDGGDDLGDARLVVGAEQRGAVGGDELVADVVGERRALLGVERDVRIARQRQTPALVA